MRPNLGPRLYLRKRKGRPTLWTIRDGDREVGTGLVEAQKLEAAIELQQYIVDNFGVSEEKPIYIYAVSAKAENFPIKIGITRDHRGRFGSLQNALPYELDVLGIWKVLDYSAERLLHRKFKHLRLKGEWFKRTPDILSFIATVAGQPAPEIAYQGHAPNISSTETEEIELTI